MTKDTRGTEEQGPDYLDYLLRLWRMRRLEDLKMNLQALRSIMFVRGTGSRGARRRVCSERSVERLAPATVKSAVEACV